MFPAHRAVDAARVGIPTIALAVVLSVALAGCRVAEAKAWNLDQLHTDETRHRYSAILQSDLEFVLRTRVEALFRSTGATFAAQTPEPVPAPADECLDNLVALGALDDADPNVAAIQVEWFARLAVLDPWRLSRERAALALGRAGVRLAAGLPARLGSDQTPADAEAVAGAIAPLVDLLRSIVEGAAPAAGVIEAACDRVRALDLDLDGARRALRAVNQLADLAETKKLAFGPARGLALDLERVCVRRALASAIDDADPHVRAAALRSAAEIGGRAAIDAILFERLTQDGAPEPLIAILDLVGIDGLPDPAADAAPVRHSREAWMEAIVSLLSTRPEGEARVHAMRCLARLSRAGITSLREEDWQAWWLAHHALNGSLP